MPNGRVLEKLEHFLADQARDATQRRYHDGVRTRTTRLKTGPSCAVLSLAASRRYFEDACVSSGEHHGLPCEGDAECQADRIDERLRTGSRAWKALPSMPKTTFTANSHNNSITVTDKVSPIQEISNSSTA